MGTLDNLTTVVITLITVLFSASAWKFYETKMKLSADNEKEEKNDKNMYRDDLRDRVRRLEQSLQDSSDEKDQMRLQILALTQEVSELRVKVSFLEKENERLKNI